MKEINLELDMLAWLKHNVEIKSFRFKYQEDKDAEAIGIYLIALCTMGENESTKESGENFDQSKGSR